MAKVYHYHADVGLHGSKDCGLLNAHDASCSKGVLTDDNETDCEKQSKNFPVGKPHKCTHKVPDDQLAEVLRGGHEVDIWVVSPRRSVKKKISSAKKTAKANRRRRSPARR
jgi:hypothetical protein